MSVTVLFDVGAPVIAKTFIAPIGNSVVEPGMAGEVIGREEPIRRHKVRFENGREVWATSDQIKLEPEYAAKKKAEEEAEKKRLAAEAAELKKKKAEEDKKE